MKQKHYPVKVCGHKAVGTVELTWNYAKVCIKIPHRRGQSISIATGVYWARVDVFQYLDYTTVQFWVKQSDFWCASEAVADCAAAIIKADKHVNLESDNMNLVTKELLMIMC